MSANGEERIVIKKPITDDAEYRYIELPNGLRCVVASDSRTDKAAASVSVSAGSCTDPDSVPGLMHLLEHMMSHGTAKYPDEAAYRKFVESHGGNNNASTSLEYAEYHFDVEHSALPTALDMFAQCFVSPLLSSESFCREIHAVDSEHRRNLLNDSRRTSRVLSAVAKQTHQMSKFGTGSQETLGAVDPVKLRADLLALHSTWYRPSAMSLAVLGREPLDELERLVRSLFSDVPVGSVPEIAPLADPLPFAESSLGSWVRLVPVRDEKKLLMLWQTPEGYNTNDWRTKPQDQLSFLLGHESEGSVLYDLKRRNLATSLVAGLYRQHRDYALFECEIELTDEGARRTDEVALTVFQYLAMLRSVGPLQWVFEEQSSQRAVEFQYYPKMSPTSLVGAASYSLMRRYPVEELWRAPHHLLERFDPEGVTRYLGFLTPENCIAVLQDKAFEPICDVTEKWYGVKYRVDRFSEDQLSSWRNPQLSPNLHVPPRNPFLPSLEGIALKAPATEEPGVSFPKEVHRTAASRCFFKQDRSFGTPKVVLVSEIVTPLVVTSARDRVLMTLFVDLLDDEFNAWTYLADCGGLSYELKSGWRGMKLRVVGFNEKAHAVLRRIAQEMRGFAVKVDRFEVAKEAYIRRCSAWYSAQPTSIASEELACAMKSPRYTVQEKVDCARSIVAGDITDFSGRLWTTGVRLVSHFQGNLTEEEAVAMARSLEEDLHAVPLPVQSVPELRTVALPCGAEAVRHFRGLNPANVNSSVCDYFSVCRTSAAAVSGDYALLMLIAFVMAEPCFTVLRTKEQLGYVVWSYVKNLRDLRGLAVAVQSSEHPPEHVEERIEAFVNGFAETIRAMPDEEFRSNKESLVKEVTGRDLILSDEASRFWREIKQGFMNWTRRAELAAAVSAITKQQLLEFYERNFTNKATRRKVCIQIHGKNHLELADPASSFVEHGQGAIFRKSFPLSPCSVEAAGW